MQFLKDMITLNPADFGGPDIPIGLILLCFAIGMILATVAIQIGNAVVFRTVKALLRHKCTDEESAKSLDALHLASDRLIAFAIKRENPMLMRHISVKAPKAAAPTAQSADPKDGADGEAVAEMADICAFSETPKAESTVKAPIRPAEPKIYLSAEQADRAKQILSRGEGGVLQTVGLCALLLVLYFGLGALATYLLPMLF